MAVSNKFIKRASTATLLMWLIVSLISPLAYAEDTVPTDTPAVTPAPDPPSPPPAESTPPAAPEPTTAPALTETPAPVPALTETTVPIPTETPAPEPAAGPESPTVTDTGDAAATAKTRTDVNQNTTIIPGSIDTAGCTVDGQSGCQGDALDSNKNAATASAELNSLAATGGNTATGSADTAISTGDAAATGVISTNANANSDILQPPASTDTPEATPTPTPGESLMSTEKPGVSNELTVNNSNAAEVANTADVTSLTGSNSATANSGTVTTDTGNATSLTSVLNVINTNIVGSDVTVINLDLTCHDGQDVDLNSIWKELLTVDESGNVVLNTSADQNSGIKITITNSNWASVENTVSVTANTGDNTATGSAGTNMTTGDAYAAANVTNFVNTNIVGSKILMANINILAASNINLILPRPEFFDAASSVLVFRIPVTGSNQNRAEITNSVSATANSGGNFATGDAVSTITGDATAIANTTTIANTNITGNSWFFMILNNAGGWTGNILNWSAPGSIEKPATGANILQTGINASEPAAGETGATTPAVISNSNTAEVTNNITVSANTGGNTVTSQNGDAKISSGNARAVANLFNLINTNILGSRWFMNNVNIMGDWSGNAIFAYPDVRISVVSDKPDVQPGDIISLGLQYGNTGYDTARGVRLTLDLPAGMSYVSDTGKLTGGCQQTFCSWEVGTLTPGQNGEYGVRVKINDDFSFDKKTAWDMFMPTARAESNRSSREVPVKATIQLADPDLNTGNNSYSLQTVVYEKLTAATNTVDQRQPEISLTASHNVNNFVYPGDTVTFEMKISNNSDAPLYTAQLVQKIYGADGQYLGSMLFELGTVEAHKSGRLTFGLTVPVTAGAGTYSTEANVTGRAANGNQITTTAAATRFAVRVKPTKVAVPVSAGPTTGSGEVLGASTTYRGPWCTDRNQDIWIFIMLLITSSVLFANRLENRMDKNYVKKTG